MARTRGIVAVSLFILVALAATVYIVYWHGPFRGLPYHDSFVKSRMAEWQGYGGSWEIINGSMHNNSDEPGAKLLAGSPYWTDYSVEGDVMPGGIDGDLGFILRSNNEQDGVDAYNGYYAGLRTADSSLVLGRAGYGWAEVSSQPQALGHGELPPRWYHLKILAYKCRVVAAAGFSNGPILALASMTDQDCIRRGRMGLRTNQSGGIWRNVFVRRATQGDLDDLIKNGPASEEPYATFPSATFANFNVPLAPLPGDRSKALPSNPNTQTINQLRLDAMARPVKGTIRGVVILTSPAVFVEDSSGGIAIRLSTPTRLKIGDEVEASGEARTDGFALRLESAAVRVLWEGAPLPPVSVTAPQVATGAFEATLVELEGTLQRKQYSAYGSCVFDFDAGYQSFRAIVNCDRSESLYRMLMPESSIRVRGVAVTDSAYTSYATPFAVLLVSASDIEVIAGPPFWTAGHLLMLALALFGLALVIGLLYRRIEKWRLRAVFEERERLAYEMHDTLAQSVAGIGFQLEAIRVGVPDDLARVHQQLDLASELIRHSHTEARRSVEMLRPRQLESEGLLAALNSCANRLVAAGSVAVFASSSGEPRPLSLRLADSLYRIGQEALANAVRHARPTAIHISLDYEKDCVRLLIRDNGVGFTEDQSRNGLGVIGMKKRADLIGADLTIYRLPEGGAAVSVRAPLPPRITLMSWPTIQWKILREFMHDGTSNGKTHPHPGSR